MIGTIAVAITVLWALGLVVLGALGLIVGHTGLGLIHLLLAIVVVAILIVVRLIQGRNVT